MSQAAAFAAEVAAVAEAGGGGNGPAGATAAFATEVAAVAEAGGGNGTAGATSQKRWRSQTVPRPIGKQKQSQPHTHTFALIPFNREREDRHQMVGG